MILLDIAGQASSRTSSAAEDIPPRLSYQRVLSLSFTSSYDAPDPRRAGGAGSPRRNVAAVDGDRLGDVLEERQDDAVMPCSTVDRWLVGRDGASLWMRSRRGVR